MTSNVRSASLALGLLLACALAGCAPSSEANTNLLETNACEQLTLGTELALPNSKELGSQFLNGWWPVRGEDWLRAPTGAASIALATDGRAEQLFLEAELKDGEVAASASGTLAVQRVEGGFALDVAALPAGLHTIDLKLPAGSRVRGARLRARTAQDEAQRSVHLCLVPEGSTAVARWKRGAPWQIRAGQEVLLDSATPSGRGARELSVSGSVLTVVTEPGTRLTLEEVEHETRAPVEERSASGEQPDVVLLYVQDALRADTVDELPEGSVWKTLSREGLRLLQHRSVAPNTLPSTKALFTGQVWGEGGGRALPEELPTLAEAFQASGYRTALFSNNPWISSAYALDRGFDHATDALPTAREPFFDDVSRVHAAALDWMRSIPDEEPLFLYVHVLHPHNPYDPPQRFADRCPPAAIDGSTESLSAIRDRRLSPQADDQERLQCLYRGSLAYADEELAVFLEALRGENDPTDTLAVLTSDHGEEFFEHDGVLHGYTLFEEQLRIPLIAHWPGRLEPDQISDATSTLNVHRSLVALAKGQGLRAFREALVEPQDEHFAAAASVRGGIFSLQRRGKKLIWAPRHGRNWGQGQGRGRRRDALESYDLGLDSEEQQSRPTRDDAELWLRLRTLSELALGRLDVDEDGRETVDAELQKRLRALGYLDG